MCVRVRCLVSVPAHGRVSGHMNARDHVRVCVCCTTCLTVRGRRPSSCPFKCRCPIVPVCVSVRVRVFELFIHIGIFRPIYKHVDYLYVKSA